MHKIALIACLVAPALALAACEADRTPTDGNVIVDPVDGNNVVVDEPEKPEPCLRTRRDLTACP